MVYAQNQRKWKSIKVSEREREREGEIERGGEREGGEDQ